MNILDHPALLKIIYRYRPWLGKFNFPKVWHSHYYSWRLKKLSPILKKSRIRKGLIVSLTVKPGREDTVHLVVKSLLRQVVAAERVILWISTEEFSKTDMPDELLALESSQFLIRATDQNLRSYNKLIPSLHAFPNKTIVTADDDILYPSWWLEKLVETADNYPNKIISYRNYLMTWSSGGLSPYKTWSLQNRAEEPNIMEFPTGVSGILYPPNSFDQRVLDANVLSDLCPTADDIWFKIHTVLEGIPVKQVFKHSQHFAMLREKQTDTLYATNQFNNDAQLRRLMEYYRLSKEDFRDQKV